MFKNEVNDKKLLKKLRKGDINSFNVLYFRFEGKLMGFCSSILKDEEAAKDVVQQVFIKIWETRKDLKKINNLDAYLFTICKHLVYNILRRQVYEFAFRNYYKETTNHLINSTEMEVDYNEINQMITSAIEKLPPKRKQIFKMSRFNGLNNKEIARDLNTSTSFIENQINKALKVLRHQIPHNDASGPRT